jgi:hypothetical protein
MRYEKRCENLWLFFSFSQTPFNETITNANHSFIALYNKNAFINIKNQEKGGMDRKMTNKTANEKTAKKRKNNSRKTILTT